MEDMFNDINQQSSDEEEDSEYATNLENDLMSAQNSDAEPKIIDYVRRCRMIANGDEEPSSEPNPLQKEIDEYMGRIYTFYEKKQFQYVMDVILRSIELTCVPAKDHVKSSDKIMCQMSRTEYHRDCMISIIFKVDDPKVTKNKVINVHSRFSFAIRALYYLHTFKAMIVKLLKEKPTRTEEDLEDHFSLAEKCLAYLKKNFPERHHSSNENLKE